LDPSFGSAIQRELRYRAAPLRNYETTQDKTRQPAIRSPSNTKARLDAFARNVTYARRSIEENSVPRSHSAVWCCVLLVLVLESCSRAKDRRAANSQRDTKMKAVCFPSPSSAARSEESAMLGSLARASARAQPADSSAIFPRSSVPASPTG